MQAFRKHDVSCIKEGSHFGYVVNGSLFISQVPIRFDKAVQKCKDWNRCCSRKYNTYTAVKSSQLCPLLACNDQANSLLFAVAANWHKQGWVSWCLNSYQNIFLSLSRIVPILLHFVNAFTQKSQEMFGCLWGAKQLILNSRIVWIETSVRKLAQTYFLWVTRKNF